jgi:hypothetical protein
MTPDDPARTVVLILDAEYGEKLRNLWVGQPIWIVMSLTNKRVIDDVLANSKSVSSLTGITNFTHESDESLSQQFRHRLGTIDLHHGRYSSATPYTRLRVIGLPLTEDEKALLSCLGFDHFESTSDGFFADRGVEEARLDHDLPN